jgi:hypothetical protein
LRDRRHARADHDRRRRAISSALRRRGPAPRRYTYADYAGNLRQLLDTLGLPQMTGLTGAASEHRDSLCSAAIRLRPPPPRWPPARTARPSPGSAVGGSSAAVLACLRFCQPVPTTVARTGRSATTASWRRLLQNRFNGPQWVRLPGRRGRAEVARSLRGCHFGADAPVAGTIRAGPPGSRMRALRPFGAAVLILLCVAAPAPRAGETVEPFEDGSSDATPPTGRLRRAPRRVPRREAGRPGDVPPRPAEVPTSDVREAPDARPPIGPASGTGSSRRSPPTTPRPSSRRGSTGRWTASGRSGARRSSSSPRRGGSGRSSPSTASRRSRDRRRR